MLHRSLPAGPVGAVGAGALGPISTGPVPLNEDEEYVGASPGLLAPLLLAGAFVTFGGAFWWERRKDRRVAAARNAFATRIDRIRTRPSENTK